MNKMTTTAVEGSLPSKDQQPRKSPVVTGLSPKEGIPGTQITIRGENLGLNQSDLIGLHICGTDCLMTARWESAHKIVARVGQAKGGLGDVLVATKSGGKGMGTVKFRVYTVQIGPLQESAVWVDETRTVPGRERMGNNCSSLVDEDPLGIGDKADERNKMSESTLLQLFPDGSGNLRLDNFVPAWYLLEKHRNASFADLKSGQAYLENRTKSLKEGPKNLLKANLHSFISCVDSLAVLHDKLQLERNTRGWPLTRNLKDKVSESKNTADCLFADVLSRKDKADSTRNALSVLTRFRFLFFLPQNIDSNAQKGEYSLILNDYSRAKLLFGDTDIPLFREAMEEVEKKMTTFKMTLKERLIEMPSNFDEQRKIIRYLLILEPDSDPCWDCLTAYYNWLENTLWDMQHKLWIASISGVANESSSDVDEKLVLEIPQRYNFVGNAITMLTSKLLPFWKLAQTYISGFLSTNSVVYREDDVEQMLIGCINQTSWLILNALLPESLPNLVVEQYGDRFVKWSIPNGDHSSTHLLSALSNVRHCICSLLEQEFSRKQVQPLIELCTTIRLKCLARVVERAREGILALTTKENWKLQSDESEYSKTQLPELFETQIVEILPIVQQLLNHNGFPDEPDLFANDRFRSLIVDLFQLLVTSFKETIERLVRLSKSDLAPSRPVDLSWSKSNAHPVKGRKLLIALNNVDHCLNCSLEMACKRLAENGVQFVDRVLQNTVLLVVFVQAELFLVGSECTAHVLNFVVRTAVEKLCQNIGKLADRPDLGQVGATQITVDLAAFESSVTAQMTNETRQLLIDMRAPFSGRVDHQIFQQCLRDYRDRMRLTLLSLQEINSANSSCV